MSSDGVCGRELQQLFSPPAALPPGTMHMGPQTTPIDASGTGWLSDTHVANISSIFTATKGSAGRAGSAQVLSCTTPNKVLTNLQLGRHGLRQVVMNGRPAIQTMVADQHFTALAVDSLSKRAYIWDPRLMLGGGICPAWIEAVTSALAATLPGMTVSVWAVDLQRDSHQCGVWAAFYMAMWLVWLRTVSSGCFHTWLEERVRGDGAAPSGTAAAEAFIGRFRRAVAELHAAALALPGAFRTVQSTSPQPPGLGTAAEPITICSPERPRLSASSNSGILHAMQQTRGHGVCFSLSAVLISTLVLPWSTLQTQRQRLPQALPHLQQATCSPHWYGAPLCLTLGISCTDRSCAFGCTVGMYAVLCSQQRMQVCASLQESAPPPAAQQATSRQQVWLKHSRAACTLPCHFVGLGATFCHAVVLGK